MGKHTSSGLGGFMSGASIRFSKMKGSGGCRGADAWRESLMSSRSGPARARTSGTEMPKMYSIHRGTVVSVQEFGAFIQLGSGDKYKDGLLHISCLCSDRPERVQEVIDTGMNVWVKVTDLNQDDLKYSLDMRYVSQKDGTDLDPYQAKGKLPDNGMKNPSTLVSAARKVLSVQPESVTSPGGGGGAQPSREVDPCDASGDSSSESSRKAADKKKHKKVKKRLKKAAKKLEKARKKAEKAKKKLEEKARKTSEKAGSASSSSSSSSSGS